MKRLFLIASLSFPLLGLAKPYISEYQVGAYRIIFNGDVAEQEEEDVKVLEKKYLETLYAEDTSKYYLESALNKLGVTVEKVGATP